MFDLVYIKSEDREELRLLREERDRTGPADKTYKGIVSKISKIEKTRKSLKDCNMEEATDFRKYLAEKISKPTQINRRPCLRLKLATSMVMRTLRTEKS